MRMSAVLIILTLLCNYVYARAPNIIFLMADDMGWNDPGWQNNDQIKTPSLEFLRDNGQTLEWFYAQSSCSPTRASLMTGRYPIHHGIYRPISGSIALPTKFKILPEILNENGYQTHMIGKWVQLTYIHELMICLCLFLCLAFGNVRIQIHSDLSWIQFILWILQRSSLHAHSSSFDSITKNTT